jgi:RNA polymerase sigma factor (sigma-70 family)
MTREEEREIIRRVKGGDVDAFEALVLANQKQVYTLAFKMLGNEQDANDVSQEAFLKAYRALDSFREDSKFSVWLYRLTSNLCIDFLRSRSRRQAISLSVLDADGEEKELDIPDEHFSPQELLERSEIRQAVRDGLAKLPEDYRQILLLREIDGLSYAEIGQALSLEEGTVKSRIFRARKKLCSILIQNGNISESISSEKTGKEGYTCPAVSTTRK